MPQIWPYVLTVGLLLVLAYFGWRRRAVAGALPFAVACLLAFMWVASATAGSVVREPTAKLAWFKFQAVWQLPALTAITCFVLDYASRGRWLTRRTLILLSIPPLLELALVLTNELHHWCWLRFSVGAAVVPLRGPIFWTLFAYSLGLTLVGNVTGRSLHALEIVRGQATSGWNPFLPSILIPFGMYATALFGFRILDPPPAARRAAIEQMPEGMESELARNQIQD